MAFKDYFDKIEDATYTNLTKANKFRVSLHLEIRRVKYIDSCVNAYREAGYDISRHRMIKLMIDAFKKTLDDMEDDDAIEYLIELHKEALF